MNLPNFDKRPYHFWLHFVRQPKRLQLCSRGQPGPYVSEASPTNPQGGFNMHLMASYTLTCHLRISICAGTQFPRTRPSSIDLKGNEEQLERASAVNLDVPLLLKWRTDRLIDVAAYALGGVKYRRSFQSQEDVRQEEDSLQVYAIRQCGSLDIGAGVGIFPAFLSRCSHPRLKQATACSMSLVPGKRRFMASPLEFLRTRSFVLSVCF